MKWFLGWLGIGAQLLGPLCSVGEDAVGPATVRVEVQMVSLSTERGLKLVPLLRDPATAVEAFSELQGLLAREEATLLGWPIVWVARSRRGSSHSFEECNYQDEPHFPVGGGVGVHPRIEDPTWSYVLSDFQTRDLGPALEVEAHADSNHQTVKLEVMARLARLVAFHRFLTQPSPLEIQGLIQLPEISRSEIHTTLTLRSGQPALLSLFTIPAPNAHLELFVIRATILPKADATPHAKQP